LEPISEKSHIKRRIIVEIKKEYLTIDDIYQVKKRIRDVTEDEEL